MKKATEKRTPGQGLVLLNSAPKLPAIEFAERWERLQGEHRGMVTGYAQGLLLPSCPTFEYMVGFFSILNQEKQDKLFEYLREQEAEAAKESAASVLRESFTMTTEKGEAKA